MDLEPLGHPSTTKAAVKELRATLPKSIADHELIRIIGSGSYGDVVLARNSVTGSYRAIKIVWRNAFDHPRPYAREFEAIQRFEPISRSYEGFVPVLQIGRLENAFYYIMELADDETSGREVSPNTYQPRCLKRNASEPLPVHECISIGSSLAKSLAALHKSKLIHRDIKPSNIIFVNGQPKLADIGLVTQIDEANSMVGTVGFIPPEGPVRPESDIFSLGKVLYEISTGNDRCEFPELPGRLTEDMTLYLELNEIILKACNPQPEKRYRTAAAMHDELELLQGGRSIKRLRQVQKQYRFARICFAAVLLLGVGAFTAKAWHDREAVAMQRRAAYMIARGTDRMADGDFASALPFFLAAAKEDPGGSQNHRLRVGSVVALGIHKVRSWQGSTNATFSADGRWILMHGPNGLDVRDSLTGDVLETVAVKAKPPLSKLSPDKSMIGLANGTGFTLRHRITKKETDYEFRGKILCLAFHPNGSEIAVGFSGGFARLNLKDGTITESETDFSVLEIVHEPNGDRIMLFSDSGEVQVWHGGEPGVSARFKHNMAYAGVFSPFYKSRVLTAGYDFAAYWDVTTGEEIIRSLEHEYGAHCLAYSPNQMVLASGGLDRTVRLSDSKTLRPLPKNHVLYHPDRVLSVAFIDDQTLVAHCDDASNHVWDLSPPAPELKAVPWHAFPNRREAEAAGLAVCATNNLVRVRNGTDPALELRMEKKVSTVSIHPDGNLFAVGTQDDDLDHHSVLVFDRRDLSKPKHRLRHLDGITYTTFSASGKKLATCSEDHTAILWDVETGTPFASPLKHGWQVHWAAFNADESWLATASWDGTVIIWDAQTCDPLTPPLSFGTHLEWMKFEDVDQTIIAGNVKHKKMLKMELPFAALPLDQYTGTLPAPISLGIHPDRF